MPPSIDQAIEYYDNEVIPMIGDRLERAVAIYFIGTDEVIKIGLARYDPDKRVSVIQNSSPFELHLYGCILGTVHFERVLHSVFAPFRSHGEWFDLEENMLDGLAEIIMHGADYGRRKFGIEFSLSVPCEAEPSSLLLRPLRRFPLLGQDLAIMS